MKEKIMITNQDEISTEDAMRLNADKVNQKTRRQHLYNAGADPGESPASYGMNHRELEEERIDQVRHHQKMTRCNLDPRFPMPLVEIDFVFLIAIEYPLFEKDTGIKISKPQLKRFNVPAWNLMEKVGQFRGSTLEILHDPTRPTDKDALFMEPFDRGQKQKKSKQRFGNQLDMASELLEMMGLPTKIEKD